MFNEHPLASRVVPAELIERGARRLDREAWRRVGGKSDSRKFAEARVATIETARKVLEVTRPQRLDFPRLGGGLTPVEWLRMGAAMDHKKGAHFRALEAETIADWIEATLGMRAP